MVKGLWLCSRGLRILERKWRAEGTESFEERVLRAVVWTFGETALEERVILCQGRRAPAERCISPAEDMKILLGFFKGRQEGETKTAAAD